MGPSLEVAPSGAMRPPPTRISHWAYRHVNALFGPAGVTLDGDHPWDPQVRCPSALSRVLLHGTMGAGESYVDGDWECEALDEFTARLLAAEADRPLAWRSGTAIINEMVAHLRHQQTRVDAKRGVTAHYDIGEDLYEAMLGPTRSYSCGYWRAAATLDAAQHAKHALICEKLQLRSGLRLLDVGCGWGGLAEHAARYHGVEVVGITISASQAAYAKRRCAGLPVEILEVDYRDARGRFDRVVSVGMLEHVGPANYGTFFSMMMSLLAPDGLLLLHTIGALHSVRSSDPWLARYIFPGTVLPSAAQLTGAFEGRLVLEDWENFGADYDRTLMAWHERFEDAWPTLSARYSERFHRLWRYYLLTCAGTFRARRNQVWQLVLSPHGVSGGYRRPALG